MAQTNSHQAGIRNDWEILIVEPVAIRPAADAPQTLTELLESWDPEPDFPDVDDRDLAPLRDVDLA